MNALITVVIGVLLLAGLHKLQGYLWRKNFERKRFFNPEQRPPDKPAR